MQGGGLQELWGQPGLTSEPGASKPPATLSMPHACALLSTYIQKALNTTGIKYPSTGTYWLPAIATDTKVPHSTVHKCLSIVQCTERASNAKMLNVLKVDELSRANIALEASGPLARDWVG